MTNRIAGGFPTSERIIDSNDDPVGCSPPQKPARGTVFIPQASLVSLHKDDHIAPSERNISDMEALTNRMTKFVKSYKSRFLT